MPDPRGPDPDVPDLVAALEADLVSLAHAEADLDRDGEVAERIRIERGAVTLADRLRGSRSNVEIELLGATGRVTGRLVDDGDGWVVLRSSTDAIPRSREHLVALSAVVSVLGLGRATAPSRSAVSRSWASVLRTWSRDRSEVTVRCVHGQVIVGRADAAYADHLDVITGGGVRHSVAYAAMACVSR